MMTIFNTIELENNCLHIGDGSQVGGNGFLPNIQRPTTIEIEETYNGKTVTVIGQYAFYRCTLTSVSLPKTLIAIHQYAFDLSRFSSDEFNFPNLEYMGSYALSSCSFKKIVFGPNIILIDSHPFPNNKVLEQIIVDQTNQFYSNDYQYCLFNKNQTLLIQVAMARTKIIIPETVIEI